MASQIVKYQLDDSTVVGFEVEAGPGWHQAGAKEFVRVDTICAFTHGSSTLLAAGGVDDHIHIVNLTPIFHFDDRRRFIQSGKQRISHDTVLDCDGPVNAICAFTLDETTLLAAANANHTLRIWPLSVHPHRRTLYERDQTLHGHEDIVNCICSISLVRQPPLRL